MTNFLESTIGNRYFVFLVRVLLGFLFVLAAMEKIAQPEAFAKNISYYRLLPTGSINILAIVLPWIELLAGLFLLMGLVVRGSSLLITVLLGVFILAIGISIARGLDISCGCFGTTSARKVGWTTLAEDLLMLAGALLVYYFPNTPLSMEAYLRRLPQIQPSKPS